MLVTLYKCKKGIPKSMPYPEVSPNTHRRNTENENAPDWACPLQVVLLFKIGDFQGRTKRKTRFLIIFFLVIYIFSFYLIVNLIKILIPTKQKRAIIQKIMALLITIFA